MYICFHIQQEDKTVARIDKSALTKLEIVTEATKQFLEKGFSNTTVSSIAKELEMSTGNLTFHYPTKEHLLAELVDLLCKFIGRRNRLSRCRKG